MRDIVTTSWSADHIGFLLLNIYLVGPTSWFCVLFYIARSGLLHFDHVKKKDTRLRQILVNHHIATSPELAGKAPKPRERNLKRKANE